MCSLLMTNGPMGGGEEEEEDAEREKERKSVSDYHLPVTPNKLILQLRIC